MARSGSPVAPDTSNDKARARRALLAGRPSAVSDGAVIERLARMRAACQALAMELAGTRRELKVVEAELRRLKRRHGGD